MSGDETAPGQPASSVSLRDGRPLWVDALGVHVGGTLYPLDHIQDARIVSPEPKTIGLRVAVGGLITLVPERPEDADQALEQLFQLRPSLRPAGYVNPTLPQFTAPPLSYLPPPLYGAPPTYPAPGYPPTYPSPYAPPPAYGPPPGMPGYPPPTFLPTYGPPPAYPGYPIVPPPAGAPGSPHAEGGVGFWPQGIGEVLGTGFRLYFKRFGALFTIGLLTVGLPTLLSGLITVGIYYALGFNPLQGTLLQELSVVNATSGNVTYPPLIQWLMQAGPQQIALLISGAALWFVLSLLFGAWSAASLALGAREAIAGRPVRVGAAVGGGLRRMWTALGTQILVGLIVIGLFIVLIVLFFILIFVFATIAALSTGNSSGAGSGVGAALATFGGIIVLYVVFWLAYLYFMIRLYMAAFAAAADRLSPFAAFGRSWSLTWRNWWRTFLPLLVVWIAAYIVTYAAAIVEFFSIAGGAVIALPLLSSLTAPLFAVMALTIYYDLRLRHEGYPPVAMDLGLALPPPPPLYPPPFPPSGPAQPVPPSMG